AAQLAAADVPAGWAAEITVGPFEWVPSQAGHECMFMVASADGDPSNVDNFTAGDSIPDWRLVPNDNNIGQRNVAPVVAFTGKRLADGFSRMSFRLKNPLHRRGGQAVQTGAAPLLGGGGVRGALGQGGGPRGVGQARGRRA